MTHLSPGEFVDLVDGALPPSRAAHVQACAECRSQALSLQSLLIDIDAQQVVVPEPPPFFWDRLSARVRAAVAETRPSRGLRGLLPFASAAALIVAVVGGAWLARQPDGTPAARVTNAVAVDNTHTHPAALDDAALDAANGEVWDVLTSIATDMRIDEAAAAGMDVRPAALDRAVQKMSPDELTELARLLQSELKRPGH